ncbi:MAG: helix-turn-helix domain-containing protein, partial [Castellaniella sp.]
MRPVELAPLPTKLDGDTPAIRLFALLEVIAEKDQYFSLQSLVEELGLPKPTLHRMLQQLDSAGMIQRDGDGRHYSTGVRLRRIAENLLLNNTCLLYT